jgi:septal ring factor EnvC (AmiA/AmiB activator)
MTRRFAGRLAILAWVFVSATTFAEEKPSANVRHKHELQQEQSSLKVRLKQMKDALAADQSAHAEAADALAASEVAISRVNRQLQQLADSRHQVQKRIAELQARQQDVLHARDTVTTYLGATLNGVNERRLAEPAPSPVAPERSLQTATDLAYLDVVVQTRRHRIDELEDKRTQLAALEAESRQQETELMRLDREEQAGRAQLIKQQAAHKKTLDHLAEQIRQHKKSVAGLERDDARLGALIGRIEQLLADENRKNHAPAKGGGGKSPPAKGSVPGVGVPDLTRAGPMTETRFFHAKGHLRLPAVGSISSRFGAPRLADDGSPVTGAPAWKGVFIKAENGAPVHAVAAGQVVFADWLRGFGNLIIVDHAEGFLSVYAFNESLLRSVGDTVAADDVLSTVGSSGGNAQSGLYFEMRYQGQAFDPLTWAVAR